MFTCHCLNVALEVEDGADDALEVSAEEVFEGVLAADQWTIGKVRAVSRTHPSLTRAVPIGQWRVTRCLNCGQYTHATNPNRPTRTWLNVKLLDETAANRLKSSDLVSPIFHVVINPNGIDVDVDSCHGDVTREEEEEEVRRNELNGVVSCYVSREEARIAEEIRKFSEKRYEQLNNLREGAVKEAEVLMEVARKAKNGGEAALQMSPPPRRDWERSPVRPTGARALEVEEEGEEGAVTSSDDMLMFAFEEFEGGGRVRAFELDGDSDSDDVDEAEDAVAIAGVRIPHAPPPDVGGIAKSCPVDIPNYARPAARERRDAAAPEGGDAAPRFDIAASIKALAKSVHGDAIFGELPRPKFSTQI